MTSRTESLTNEKVELEINKLKLETEIMQIKSKIFAEKLEQERIKTESMR